MNGAGSHLPHFTLTYSLFISFPLKFYEVSKSSAHQGAEFKLSIKFTSLSALQGPIHKLTRLNCLFIKSTKAKFMIIYQELYIPPPLTPFTIFQLHTPHDFVYWLNNPGDHFFHVACWRCKVVYLEIGVVPPIIYLSSLFEGITNFTDLKKTYFDPWDMMTSINEPPIEHLPYNNFWHHFFDQDWIRARYAEVSE